MYHSSDNHSHVKLRQSWPYRTWQSMRWGYSCLGRNIAFLFSKFIKKEWLSNNHWLIDGTVLVAFAGFFLLLLWIVFHLFIVRLIWIYQHFQCYTRERAIQWTEGPTHAMRRQCPLIHQYKTSLQQQSNRLDPSKICITTLSDSAAPKGIRCRNFDNVSSLTWPNHLQYANKHGYVAVDQSNLLDPSRPPAWSKILAVQEMFSSNQFRCEWVLWLDADTVIMNSSILLESIVPRENENVDLIVTTDRRFTANSGVWLIRNSPWSRQFLKDWWNLKSFVRPSGLSLSGDNDAFGYLVRQYDSSLNEGSSISHKESVESKGSSHIRLIPRCRMNSFGVFIPSATSLRSFSNVTKEEWHSHSDHWYYDGDFIAHASGIDRKDVGVALLLARAT